MLSSTPRGLWSSDARSMAVEENEIDGGCVQSSLKTQNGYNIATYKWSPPCGDDASVGCVFLMHGIFSVRLCPQPPSSSIDRRDQVLTASPYLFSLTCPPQHICFEYLEPDSGNLRNVYEGSLIQALNNLGYIVCGHDHPAFGRSDGLRAYVDSLDDMRDAAIDFFDASFASLRLPGKHTILGGMSMGATVAIEVTRLRPHLFDACVLFSPATRPPDDMFGLYGRLLSSVSGALNWAAPRWAAIHLPPSADPVIRDAGDKDALVLKGIGLRVRMGCEFMRVYADIDACADEIVFKSLVVFVGEKDNVVSPAGMKQFYSRVRSEDKTLVVREGMQHEVLRETIGREETHAKVIEWVKARTPQ